jgi:hypothetical protein
MNDEPMDHLRDRLRSLDPAGGSPDLAPSAIDRLKEHAMTQQDTAPQPANAPTRRRAALIAAAAAVVALGGVGGYQLMQDDAVPPIAATPTVNLDLSMPSGDIISSCMMFDETFLADMSPAFKGTATEVTGDQVTLRVDTWYAGAQEADNATQVTLTSGGEEVLLEGGITFTEGTTYLITAAEGTVNSCGYSGEATPEFEASFERAFGG